MKKAFSLVELLVVIAIIAILAGVILGTFSGGTESARAAKCLTNMRNLAAACQSYGMARDYYPTAGSAEMMDPDEETGKLYYYEHHGWIGWNSQGAYSDGRKPSSIGNQGWHTSTYNTDEETRKYVLTNSVLWKYVSCNADIYRCPVHIQKMKDLNPNWSYVMNAYFGWDSTHKARVGIAHEYGKLKRADRRLLFAELPFAGLSGQSVPTGTSGEQCDCVLQYDGCKGCGTPESIGFNHKVGKRSVYAHVCFADGHVEKLAASRDMSEADMRKLTKWLCEGYDVSFNGKQYEKLSRNENNN